MNYYLDNDGNYVVNGRTITEEEFHSDYRFCDCCGDAVENDEYIMTADTERIYCPACAEVRVSRCDWCGEAIEHFHSFNDSAYVCCDNCYERSDYYVCEECGGVYRYSDSGREDNNEDWYCCECIDDGCGYFDSELIGEYHDFKNSGDFKFCGAESRYIAPYLGFELEIDDGEDNDGMAQYISDNFDDFFHMERDGSLDTGFEIISQPASLSHHLSNMNDYCAMFKEAVRRGYSSHNAESCGLHIHIDKKYFESKLDSSIAKMLFIFERHWENLVRFSRRRSSQLHWCNRYLTGDSGRSLKSVVDNAKRGCVDRYYAVNLSNRKTIEIRLWRGSLRPETFEATLKLTSRIAELCKNRSAIDLAKMSFEEILGDDPIVNSYWQTVKERAV